jgi:sulfate-transporting ATPase
MAPKARQAKSKARLNAYDKMLNEDEKQKEEKLEIFIPNGPRLGDKVIEMENVSKGFDDRLLFEDLSFKLPRSGIIGVIGPNGAGKTTLFRLILDQLKPDSGKIEIGDTVKLSYVDQTHEAIDPEKTVFEVISGGTETIMLGNRQVNARAYVARFNFIYNLFFHSFSLSSANNSFVFNAGIICSFYYFATNCSVEEQVSQTGNNYPVTHFVIGNVGQPSLN